MRVIERPYDVQVASDEQPRIYVLRHGQTQWSLTGRHTGRTDIPLTTEGEQQARRAGLVLSHLRGTHLPPALVLSSPRQRAQHTAALAGLHVDEVNEDLDPLSFTMDVVPASQRVRFSTALRCKSASTIPAR